MRNPVLFLVLLVPGVVTAPAAVIVCDQMKPRNTPNRDGFAHSFAVEVAWK
jgi:hypothetical protein